MRNYQVPKVATIMGLVLIVIAAGCGKLSLPSTSTSKTTPSSTPNLGPYGELRVALSAFGTERFDPVAATTETAGNLLSPMMDFLIRMKGVDLAPGIAQSWELAPDGLSWSFFIRKGVKFHNGDDLTADDVKFSLERYLGSGAVYSDLRGMIKRVDKVDDYSVRVYTNDRQPYLPNFLSFRNTTQGLITPKGYIEQRGLQYFEQYPMGSGSFKFVRHVAGDSVEYQAVQNHWRQTPAFKNLSITLVPEATTRVAMMKVGATDLIEAGIEDAVRLASTGLKTLTTTFSTPVVALLGAYQPKAINERMPISDIKVRRALTLAINREEIAKNFFQGLARPPGPPLLDVNSPDIDVPYWMDYAAKIYRYDPEEARRLLGEAGYPNGFTFQLWSAPIAGAPDLPKLAEIVQAYWAKIGVKAELVPADWGALGKLRNTITTPQLIGQAMTWHYKTGTVTPRSLMSGFHTQGNFAPFGKTMPEVDSLINSIFSETDKSKRMEMIAKVEKTAADSHTFLPIDIVPSMIAMGPLIDPDLPANQAFVGLFLDIAKHNK